MENFAAPARPIVAAMVEAAAAAPERAVAFQGAPGANSHVAALEAFPDGLPLPCFAFEDAIDAVKDGRADCAVIPIENSLHGRVADMHFLLPELGLVDHRRAFPADPLRADGARGRSTASRKR